MIRVIIWYFISLLCIDLAYRSITVNFHEPTKWQQDDDIWITPMEKGQFELPPWSFSVSYVMVKDGVIVNVFER